MKLLLTLGALWTLNASADFTVMTERTSEHFKAAAQEFTAQTGEKVVFVDGGFDDLLTKIEAGEAADVIIAKDLIYLNKLTDKNMLQAFGDRRSLSRVAPAMADSQGRWVALTYRVRTAVYNPATVNPGELTTYQDLADPKWRARLCLRSSKSNYNLALVSQILADAGTEATHAMLSGWVKNLAVAPLKDDTSVINAIANGQCDVGVVNHYYYANLVNQNPKLPVQIAFLNQANGGVYANGIGMGRLKGSQKVASANKWLEIVLRDEFQLQISGAHFDYPAVVNLVPSTLIKNWGSFQTNATPWNSLGGKFPEARVLMDDAGYF